MGEKQASPYRHVRMKKILILSGLVLLAGSCKKETERVANACTAQNPLEELPWLKAMKDAAAAIPPSGCATRIERATYQNQPVFYAWFTGMSCDRRLACDAVFSVVLYDCQGKRVKNYYSGLELGDFVKEVTNREILFECGQ